MEKRELKLIAEREEIPLKDALGNIGKDPEIYRRFKEFQKGLKYDDTEFLRKLLEVWINADWGGGY